MFKTLDAGHPGEIRNACMLSLAIKRKEEENIINVDD